MNEAILTLIVVYSLSWEGLTVSYPTFDICESQAAKIMKSFSDRPDVKSVKIDCKIKITEWSD